MKSFGEKYCQSELCWKCYFDTSGLNVLIIPFSKVTFRLQCSALMSFQMKLQSFQFVSFFSSTFYLTWEKRAIENIWLTQTTRGTCWFCENFQYTPFFLPLLEEILEPLTLWRKESALWGGRYATEAKIKVLKLILNHLFVYLNIDRSLV